MMMYARDTHRATLFCFYEPRVTLGQRTTPYTDLARSWEPYKHQSVAHGLTYTRNTTELKRLRQFLSILRPKCAKNLRRNEHTSKTAGRIGPRGYPKGAQNTSDTLQFAPILVRRIYSHTTKRAHGIERLRGLLRYRSANITDKFTQLTNTHTQTTAVCGGGYC